METKTRDTWCDKWNKLTNNAELVKNRQKFVCEYVVLMTQKKDNRELVSGYQLKRQGSKYQILFCGCDKDEKARLSLIYTSVGIRMKELRDVFDKLVRA